MCFHEFVGTFFWFYSFAFLTDNSRYSAISNTRSTEHAPLSGAVEKPKSFKIN